MHLDLDLEHLRSGMRLWRDSLDLKCPMKDDLKPHFMQERQVILGRFEQTASAWLMALRHAAPEADSKAAFDTLIAEIEAFEAWAITELNNLSDLATAEASRSGLEELLQDPIAAAALREIARKLKPLNPRTGDAPT